MSPHKKKLMQARANRARMLKQQAHLLARDGVVWTPQGPLDRAEWRAGILKYVTSSLNQKSRTGRPFNLGNNAARAADIWTRAEASRWWFARMSTNNSGDDRRGIVHYLRRWVRERRPGWERIRPHVFIG